MERDLPITTEKRRRDAGILHVTERDILALQWITEQFCISFDHLRRLLGMHAKATTKTPDLLSPSATREAIERWELMGFIESPRKIIAEHPPYLWLTRKGLTQLGFPYPYYEPRPASIKHLYAANAIRLALESYGVQCDWTAYRTLRRQSQARPTPDAELRAHTLPLIAVRVIERPLSHPVMLHDELATMQALAARYTRLWYCVHAQAYAPLLQMVREHDAAATAEEQLTPRLVWYTLDAREIVEASP
jgi:hypothetical protein